MKIIHESDYYTRRAKAYPEITDQLDALFKIAKALQNIGIVLPADAVEILDQISAVKQTFPKSE